jgi:MFS family permease
VNARRSVGLYFGLLAVTGGLADPSGGLVDLPILFLLKDTLGLNPTTVAIYGAVAVAPRHVGFLFGLLRDRWQPRGGDRTYFAAVAVVVTALYLWLAWASLSFAGLLAAVLAIAIAFQVFDTASQALATIVAQRRLMTGRLSALMEIVDNAVSVVAMLAGGWLISRSTPSVIFMVAAAISAVILLQSFWAPRAVFAIESPPPIEPPGFSAMGSLFVHPAFWPTLAVLALYNFSPGWGTPYFYYLTSHLGLSGEAFGASRAATYAAGAAATLVYSYLCVRVSLKQLLWWAIALNVFPGFLFLLVNSPSQAIVVSALTGFLTGFGNIAVFDLLMRSCPRHMEGTASMIGFSVFGIAGSVGDLLGASAYQSVGFVSCLVLDAVATVCIVPLLAKLPTSVVSGKDGETGVEAF